MQIPIQEPETAQTLSLLNIKGERLKRLQEMITRDRRLFKLFFCGKIRSLEFTDGSCFSTRYDFLQVLGAGAFGLVFSARNLRTRAVCAIKVLNKDIMTEGERVALRDECEVLKKVNHTNVIRLLGVSFCVQIRVGQGKQAPDLHLYGVPAGRNTGGLDLQTAREGARLAGMCGKGNHAEHSERGGVRPRAGLHPPRPQA